MQELTIAELADELSMSYNGTVKKVKKLVQIHNPSKVKFSEKMSETGRKVKTVYISNDLLDKLRLEHASEFSPVKKDESIEISQVQSENSPVKTDIIEKLINDVLDSKKQLIELSEKAGKVHLLTDNLMTSKQDAEFYKNEYFKQQYEINQLTNEVNSLKDKIKSMETELDKKDNWKFWKK